MKTIFNIIYWIVSCIMISIAFVALVSWDLVKKDKDEA